MKITGLDTSWLQESHSSGGGGGGVPRPRISMRMGLKLRTPKVRVVRFTGTGSKPERPARSIKPRRTHTPKAKAAAPKATPTDKKDETTNAQSGGEGGKVDLDQVKTADQLIDATHNKPSNLSAKQLEEWAAKSGLEISHKAEWKNERGAERKPEPFQVTALRDRETKVVARGAFVSDGPRTAHVSTSFRSTVEGAFQAHDKYGPGKPGDTRLLNDVIDNSKRMEREQAKEDDRTPKRSIQPAR